MPSVKLGARKDVLLGLRTGLIMASAFSVWVIVVRVTLGPGAFARFGLGWGEMVVIYYVALSLGGCAYGALLPLKRFAAGSMLLGFLLLFPAYVAFSTAIGLSLERIPSAKVGLIIGLVLAAIGGGVLGLWEWIEDKEKKGGGDVGSPSPRN